jgi:hypothetical protein
MLDNGLVGGARRRADTAAFGPDERGAVPRDEFARASSRSHVVEP